jgi:(R,R)-butanediol dehydrogenase / meso-butanediol dehydrogenase / diacetyl reductase
MKVAVLVDIGKIEIREKPKPQVGSGDVLIKVTYCGICGSDVGGYAAGKTVQPGTVMGHESSGTVVEVDKDVHNVRVGDRVWIRPIVRCNQCYWCRKGQFERCTKTFETAIGLGPLRDGGFAEYLLADCSDRRLFKLPSDVSLEEAALIEPLIVGHHGLKVSRFRLGDRAVVIGAGPIGLGLIQFLKIAGAGKIIALEISPSRSQLARKLGADEVLNPILEGANLSGKILELTEGVGPDVVFECSGAASALQAAVNYVVQEGQIVLIGLHKHEVPFDFWTLLHRRVELKGSLGIDDDEVHDVMSVLRKKRIKAQDFISDIIDLADIEEKGFKRVIASEDVVKILVKP